MQTIDFNNFLDQAIFFGILILLTISIILPFCRWTKDVKHYSLFSVYGRLFLYNAEFVLAASGLSFLNSALELKSLSKAFDSLLAFKLPTDIYLVLAILYLAMALGFSIVDRQASMKETERK